MDTPTSEIVSQTSSRDFQILVSTVNYVGYISKKLYFKNYNFARNSVSDVVKFSKNKNSYFLLEVVPGRGHRVGVTGWVVPRLNLFWPFRRIEDEDRNDLL